MSRKAKYSKELKIKIVKKYLKGESALALANEYDIAGIHGDDRIREWARRYEAFGVSAFNNESTNKSYSKSLKEKVINEYLLGRTSITKFAIKSL